MSSLLAKDHYNRIVQCIGEKLADKDAILIYCESIREDYPVEAFYDDLVATAKEFSMPYHFHREYSQAYTNIVEAITFRRLQLPK